MLKSKTKTKQSKAKHNRKDAKKNKAQQYGAYYKASILSH